MRGPRAERVFRLTAGGVICDRRGASVAGVALLERESKRRWRVRPVEALNRDLRHAYRLPVDVGGKLAGLTVVADALQRGEIAKAQIATLLLQFPDPPPVAKEACSGDDLRRMAGELVASGLLKDQDFEDKHPRIGTPPNRVWFAPKPGPSEPAASSDPRRAWPSSEINKAIRRWVAEAADELIASGEKRLIFTLPVADAIAAFVQGLGLGELNTGEQRILDQLYANFDTPKTLEELRAPPTDNDLGYEQHHVVGQNPDNVAKQDLRFAHVLEKFGRDKLDDPDNIVWVPRLKHEEITAYYNSEDDQDPARRVRWKVINGLAFAGQWGAGLAILRKFGVLQ